MNSDFLSLARAVDQSGEPSVSKCVHVRSVRILCRAEWRSTFIGDDSDAALARVGAWAPGSTAMQAADPEGPGPGPPPPLSRRIQCRAEWSPFVSCFCCTTIESVVHSVGNRTRTNGKRPDLRKSIRAACCLPCPPVAFAILSHRSAKRSARLQI